MARHREFAKKSQSIFTWIRQRISPYCFGIRTAAGNPAHCNRNADVHAHFGELRAGSQSRRLCRLTNADMADHFAGDRTFYFTADGRSRTPEVLINIDIDCHRAGSLAGAIAFAGHLRDTQFPGLYFEASTNGNGVHGYLVVVKGDLGDQALNATLGQLDRWLKADLASGDWDVEAVEVKGQAPVFNWGRDKYELLTYRSGQLAKLSREALQRADELMATNRVTVNELRHLRVHEATREPASPAVAPRRIDVEAPVSPTMQSTPGGVPQATHVPEMIQIEPSRKVPPGSISGHHFGPEELAKLESDYLDLARGLQGGGKLVASGRKVVTAEDLAVFLMLLRFFTSNMNPDGSLPTARWRELWSALHEAGDVGRPWCHHRYAAMRNFLSGQGLLAWEDARYVIGGVSTGGMYLPGKAAKWRAGKRLTAWMEEAVAKIEKEVVDEDADRGRERESGGAEGVVSGIGNGVGAEGQDEGEEGDILYGRRDEERQHGEEEEVGRDILYGRNPDQSSILSSSFGQHRVRLDLLERLGIDPPTRRPEFHGYIWDHGRTAA